MGSVIPVPRCVDSAPELLSEEGALQSVCGQPGLRPGALCVPSKSGFLSLCRTDRQTQLAVSTKLLGLTVPSFISVQASILTLNMGFSEKCRMRRACVSVFSLLSVRHKIVRLSKQ